MSRLLWGLFFLSFFKEGDWIFNWEFLLRYFGEIVVEELGFWLENCLHINVEYIYIQRGYPVEGEAPVPVTECVGVGVYWRLAACSRSLLLPGLPAGMLGEIGKGDV